MSPSAPPRQMLGLAEELLRHADPRTAGLWPRAAALLADQALGAGLGVLWDRLGLALHGSPRRTQLICLRTYLEDRVLAARAAHASSQLRRACHHHPYELAPTATELVAWLAVVGELIASVEGSTDAR